MPESSRNQQFHSAGPLVRLTLVAGLLVGLGVAALPWEQMFPDVISFWAAGKLLASGQSPYDVPGQGAVQRAYGWEKETTGLGIYDFLPFYYPPWVAMLWVPFLPLGFAGAKLFWFFLNVELTLLAGHLLRPAVPGSPRWVPVLLAGLFLFSLACVLLGQTAALVFFLAALSWHLLEGGWDRCAGVALAWLTIKPQLTAVLLLALMLRLVWQRRWRVVGWFFLTLAGLAVVSALCVPSWPLEMLRAPAQTPSPTEHYPWIGNVWFLVLRALGLRGWLLWALYLPVALAFLGWAVAAAVRRSYSDLDVVALGLLAAFFVAPYARHYDFPVLLIPLLALRGRLAPWAGRLLLLAFLFVPYVQLFVLMHYKPLYNPGGRFLLEGTFFWVPLVLAVAWVASAKDAQPAAPAGPA